jgi:ABC-type multidrug transport system fused ATPase/permease subunit
MHRLKYGSLLHIVTPHRKTLVLILALLLAGSLASLANPWIAGKLTQSILGGAQPDLPSFQLILVGWFLLLAIKSLLGFASSYLVGSTGQNMAARLRSRVYEHLQILPMTYYQQQRPGDLLTLLSRDSETISYFVTNTLVQLLPLALTFVGAFAIMAWLDPVIALLAAVLMPVYYLAMKIIGRKIRPLSSAWIETWSGMVSLVQENLGLLPAIKAFTREPVESERFEAKNSEYLGISRKQVLIQSIMTPAISLLAGAGLLLLLWVGINHVQSGQLQTSELVSLLLYAMLLTQPVSGLAGVYGQVMHTRGAAERLLGFFAVQPEPHADGKPPIGDVRGEIEFRDVSFAYPGRPDVFSHFNLKIGAGETIALTGPNGAGKSTLAHLLMRFIDPTQGSTLIDGKDISLVSLNSLRRQIGLVAQHTLLLNGTVEENIAYGNPLAGNEDIKKAAKAARADEFIAELPDQYQTVIGDQGVRLSGGQRQRVSLARTLLKDPPILILDEATAMFDPEGERTFIEECHEILGLKTVILITHRPASLALADRVIKLTLRQDPH